MQFEGFQNLDLSNVNGGNGFTRLSEGRHQVVCKDAKVDVVKGSGNRKIVLDFEAIDGSGDIRATLNIWHGNPKTSSIARERFKAFLIASGHPNPSNPGDIASVKGLRCTIIVGQGKPWIDNGVEKKSLDVKKFLTLEGEEPVDAGFAAHASGQSAKSSFDDEIPF